MTSTSLLSGNNLADNSALVVDAAPPRRRLRGVQCNHWCFDVYGFKFDGIGAASRRGYQELFGLGEAFWDINGDNETTSNVSFTESSITSAVVTNTSL